MIEIIREEEWEKDEKKRKALPKDIRQIGKPDSGDRIYVENQAYRFLRFGSEEEKTAYVLLGRFEEFGSKWYTFVESAICLEELKFEGGLPIWTDHTWAYIFKSLSKKHDNMAIVGCAIGLRGSMPGMSVKLEAIHQKNFGGPHQIMFLMDTLEKEEVFYGNYNGRLYKKDGFYIYYDTNLPENMRLNVQEQAIDVQEPTDFNVQESRELNRQEPERGMREPEKEELSAAGAPYMEEPPRELTANRPAVQKAKQKSKRKKNHQQKDSRQKTEQKMQRLVKEEAPEPEGMKLEDIWDIEEADISGRASAQSGQYRERLKARAKRPSLPSYVPSAALIALVCLMGFAALQNQRKMDRMEEVLNQNQTDQSVAEQDNGTGNVKIETISGNVQPQGAQPNTAPESEESKIAAEPDQAGTDDEEPADLEPAVSDPEAGAVAADPPETVMAGEQASETTASETGISEQDIAEDAMAEAKAYLEQGYYIVQKGDSLVGICRKIYHTTAMLDKLCEANQIEDRDAIYAGQYLTLPN